MNRFTHSIWFFIALGSALLCGATTLLLLSQGRDDAGFLSLILPAILLSFLLPGIAALLSRKLIKWQQPLLTWLAFCLVALSVSLILLNRLLS